MTQAEGTIRFSYALSVPARTIPPALLAPLDAWRVVLKRLGLIGRDPRRYDGYGFGNVSIRDQAEPRTFWITATQTGELERIGAPQMCRVLDADLAGFRITAEGNFPPSSEALTHAAIYRSDPDVACVLHVHDPDTWRRAEELALPVTASGIEYGTVAMADAVSRLLKSQSARPLVFATLGHEDGVFGIGATPDAVACALVRSLGTALERR